jgi:hypothetical protein
MRTMLLDTVRWDLIIDAKGNIAVANEPYALAQDAASAIRTFIGECYYDVSLGVPYFEQILGKAPPLQLMREQFRLAALTVPGVVEAVCYITSVADRTLTGQVQVRDVNGVTTAAEF